MTDEIQSDDEADLSNPPVQQVDVSSSQQVKSGPGRPRKGTEAPKKVREQIKHSYPTRNRQTRATEKLSSIKEATIQIPKDVKEALRSKEAEHWMAAMEAEMSSLKKAKTWDLTTLR